MKAKILIVLVLSLSSCSAISIGYGYLDKIILNRLDNYLDLNNTQEKEAKIVIKALTTWHKKHEIPAYLAYLTQMQEHLKKNNVDQGLVYAFGQYQVLRDRLLQKMVSNLAPFIFRASKKQQAHFFETLKEEDDYLVEYLALSDSEKEEKKAKEQLKTLTQWLGEITLAQKNDYILFLKSVPDLEALRLQYHHDNQKIIQQFLQNPKNNEKKFIDRVISLRTPNPQQRHDYNKKWALVTTQYFNFFKHFLGNLSPRQRGHFISEIEDLKLDLKAIN
ncbi:MAG: DUF6279 family lipoprotein [SAR324 cluster bacterium]|nr:DUF6279 family lipoprotein [SAR324 cluster bacterium]